LYDFFIRDKEKVEMEERRKGVGTTRRERKTDMKMKL
jgi:hypothetical protein